MFVLMEYQTTAYEGSVVYLRGLYTNREKALEGAKRGLGDYGVKMPKKIEDTDTVFYIHKGRSDEHWYEILDPVVDEFHTESLSKNY